MDTHLDMHREDADHGLLHDEQFFVILWMTVDKCDATLDISGEQEPVEND